MDMMSDHHHNNEDDYETKPHLEQMQLPPIKKKKWYTRCGGNGRKVVIIVFVDGTQPLYNDTLVVAEWNVNFTVINEDSFIPTNIQNLAVNVIENGSGDVFGRGNSGHLMLKARPKDRQTITIPISINFQRDATNPAIKALLTACKIKEVDSANAPKQSLSLTFEIVYYIAGIVWHPVARVFPATYFDCPS